MDRQLPYSPPTALLVLDESTEVPQFLDVYKFVVDLARRQELRQILTAMNVQHTILVVPYTTDRAKISTWQTVIHDCLPVTNLFTFVCPEPRPFLTVGEVNAFSLLLNGLDAECFGGLQRWEPIESERVRPKTLHGLHDEQETEQAAYWRRTKEKVEGEGLRWPAMRSESEKQRRERLQLQRQPSRDDRSEEERAALLENCLLRYKRLDFRFGRVELLTRQPRRTCYKRPPFETVRRNVELFSAQQLDDFWLRMDRWEAWVRDDELWLCPLFPLIDSVYYTLKKCTTWIRARIC